MIERRLWLESSHDLTNKIFRINWLFVLLLCALASVGYVFHRQHQQLAMVAREQLTCVKQHYAAADDGKGVFELKVVKYGALWNNILQQRTQVRDIPLSVTELVDEVILGFSWRYVKSLIKRAVGGLNAQGGVEHQQGFAHGIDYVLGEVLDIFTFGIAAFRHGVRRNGLS